MSSTDALLVLLRDGRFHSGEQLAKQLGCSRSLICTQVARLCDDYGLVIYAVKGKGYQLEKSIELLNAEWLEAQLIDEKPSLHRLHVLKSIDSTNEYIQKLADFKRHSGQVCVAEMQTAGKGRRGRTWVSPFAQNIYLSLSWTFTLAPAQLSGLSLVIGIAVCRALESFGLKGIGLKWPNDVLVDNKKLAGILVEVFGEQEGPSHTVIGLGLNVSMSSDQSSIDQPWVNLDALSTSPIPRNKLVVSLVEQLVLAINAFEQRGMRYFMQAWEKRDIYYNKDVVISSVHRQLSGVYKGIDVSGAMLLETSDGLQRLFGGEVSLRPSLGISNAQ